MEMKWTGCCQQRAADWKVKILGSHVGPPAWIRTAAYEVTSIALPSVVPHVRLNPASESQHPS